MNEKVPKRFPRLRSDAEAERFLETADLWEYDFSEFRPLRFEFEKKEARVNMRLPQSLLTSVKERAAKRGIPYQRFIREAVEEKLAQAPIAHRQRRRG
jgi:predicted DNA binding CopG/RHH family protein